MNDSAETALMTTEELLALPENGMDRELICGELREKPASMPGRRHARAMGNTGKLLGIWNDQQPLPRGEVLVGDAAFRIRQNPDTTVGIDVAYVSAQLADQTPENQRFFDGVPILAVEILSPSDRREEVVDKIPEYLNVGIKVVWVIDPDLRTITVYRPQSPPQLFHEQQEISGEPELPGFRASVGLFFAR